MFPDRMKYASAFIAMASMGGEEPKIRNDAPGRQGVVGRGTRLEKQHDW